MKRFVVWAVLAGLAAPAAAQDFAKERLNKSPRHHEWAVVKNGHTKPDKALNFSEFLSEVEAGNIKSVSIAASTVKGDFVAGNNSFHTEVPSNYPKLYDMLNDKKVQMTFESSNSNGWVSILVNASPFLLLIGFWIFMTNTLTKSVSSLRLKP